MDDESEPKTTGGGIIISANTEDFSRWTWDHGYVDTISVAAAELVRKILIENARIEFGTLDGVATATFATFEYEIILEYPIAKMIENWLKIYDESERDEAEILLKALEDAAAKVRQALSQDQAQEERWTE